MTLIDTSGDYGEGRSEELIKRVIAGQRDRVFVVSKVEANDVARGAMAGACGASLSRIGAEKTYSVFHKGIAARPIRSLIASGTAPLNVTYCRGASSMVCR